MSQLRVECLTKSFGSLTVFREISFEVDEGEFCILLGPSGCGKTTLLRTVAGLEEQDSGEIWIGGREVSGLTPKERDVAMVFQSYALYPHMDAFENMAFPLRAQKRSGEEIAERVGEAARLLGIEDLLGRRPRELSGGQRQRVAIGRAIVRRPRLFLFDEPLSNLDAQLRNTMRVELARLHGTLAATTVYVTHDQVEAMTLGQKIVLLHEGRIQQIAKPTELYDRPANLFAATFIGSPRMNLVEGRLSEREGRTLFEAAGLRGPPAPEATGGRFPPGPITVGIRPEALTPGPEGVRGRLEHLEPLGPETLLYVRVGETQLVAKGPPGWRGSPGEDVSLSLGQGGIHFFRDGRRVG